MIELIDIINASKGKDANGVPKCSFSVSEQMMDASGAIKTKREQVFTSPSLNLVLNGGYIIVDLTFPRTSLTEMRVLWNYLEKFGSLQNDYFGKDDSPVLHFLVLPIEYSGKYFYTMINPICWTMQPSAPGDIVNTIRLLFEKDALGIFDGKTINDKEIDAEIDKEDRERQRLEEMDKRKEDEHQKYLDKLNDKFNAFRH